MTYLRLDNVKFEFPIYGAGRSFRQSLLKASVGGVIRRDKAHRDLITITALDDITLAVENGDRLGIIGPNGAGKSTLLRLIAGIYAPTEGNINVEGKISSLFAPGIGMDPDDTGYENIHNCGLYLGLSNKEIKSIVSEIEEFTELGDFLSLPIRTYSSGMVVRLAFAVTTAIHPEILLLDEGLGAGDAKFADKAKKRVDALVSRAEIMVLASHSDELIKTMCNKAALLHEGRLAAYGTPAEVVERYHQMIEKQMI